ncbi:hypothetical protein SGLAM104S_07874 [Streptomyces glaucescens]
MPVPSAVMFSAWMPGSREAPEGVPRSRRSEWTTSSAVTGVPSWKSAPLARVNRQVFRSSEACHLAASRGTVFGLLPGTVRVSYTRLRMR